LKGVNEKGFKLREILMQLEKAFHGDFSQEKLSNKSVATIYNN